VDFTVINAVRSNTNFKALAEKKNVIRRGLYPARSLSPGRLRPQPGCIPSRAASPAGSLGSLPGCARPLLRPTCVPHALPAASCLCLVGRMVERRAASLACFLLLRGVAFGRLGLALCSRGAPRVSGCAVFFLFGLGWLACDSRRTATAAAAAVQTWPQQTATATATDMATATDRAFALGFYKNDEAFRAPGWVNKRATKHKPL
jgi:hypothetical protein